MQKILTSILKARYSTYKSESALQVSRVSKPRKLSNSSFAKLKISFERLKKPLQYFGVFRRADKKMARVGVQSLFEFFLDLHRGCENLSRNGNVTIRGGDKKKSSERNTRERRICCFSWTRHFCGVRCEISSRNSVPYISIHTVSQSHTQACKRTRTRHRHTQSCEYAIRFGVCSNKLNI